MGKHDTAIGVWLSDKERFADLYNGALCDGETFFKAKDLEKIDTKQNLTLKDYYGKDVYIQKFRDIAMKSSTGARLFLLTCENQDTIHLGMPVRSMLYDSLDYANQIKIISNKNRTEKNYNTPSEFLSGITVQDRLAPIIPLVFYYGDEEWSKNLDLHSILDISEEEYRKFHSYIPNYKINLLNAKELAEKNCLHTDLQQILGMLQYKGDKKKLLGYIQDNR
ncbi:MAG: Rpn family recombination-promoting nuclease/putative transposase, partial [Bacillota bacterium]|nr:Rpn family recombination-promoting nuclease/putative transposase [Bacillota bacterium]